MTFSKILETPGQKRRDRRVFSHAFPMIAISVALLLFFSSGKELSAAEAIKNKPSEVLDRVTLQLKWRHQFQFAGYYAALEKGFYRDAGLDVTIVESRDSEESFRPVIDGRAEFGVAMSDLALLRGQGHPVIALACIYQHSPLVFLAPKSAGVENIHDLAGKRIMLEPHSAELLAYLKNERVSAREMILHPHSYDISGLLSGKIDAISAYCTDEPFMLENHGIDYSVFSPRAGGIDFYGDTLFTVERQTREHPERVAAFLSASLEGWKHALANPDEIIDLILSKYSRRHSREHLEFEAEKSRRLIMSDVVEIGYMNPGRWRHIADTYIRMNMIPPDFSIDGLIYEKNPSPDLTRIYGCLAGALLLASLALFISARFYKLNHALADEIATRKHAQARLEESERTTGAMLSNLPGMVYQCENDEFWTMKFVSDGCLELFGLSPADLVDNEKVAFASLIHPDDREMVRIEVKKALEDFRPFKLVYRAVHASGETKWVFEQGRPIFDKNGAFRFIEGFITDISDQKRAENEKEILIGKLRKAIDEIKVLRGILPICSGCKKIRDESGRWTSVETYIGAHSEADFSHGICPDCAKKIYPDFKLYEE